MGRVTFVESSEPILTEPLIYLLPARVAVTSKSAEHPAEPAPDPSGSDSTGETSEGSEHPNQEDRES